MAQAQTPSFRWAKRVAGTNSEVGSGIAVDGGGNSYVTGYFQSTNASFNPTTILTNIGKADVFVAKYDFGGNVIWAKRAGGTADDFGTAIASDLAGNLYVTGYFLSSNANFSGTILTNSGSADVFVAKYDTAGNLAWAKAAGGAGYDAATGIAVDGAGNSYVTGLFYSTNANFGGVALTNGGQNNVFVTKFDPSGTVLWARQAGGTSFDSGLAIAADAAGNVYVTGSFFSPTSFFGGLTLTNSGENDIFVARYDTAGNVLWARTAKGLSDDFGYGIAVDGASNSYVAGYFLSTNLTFSASIILTNTSHNNDVFVAKYDPNGTPLWARKAGGTSDDYAFGIALDAATNVYVAGNFYSTNGNWGALTLTNRSGTNSHDVFVARYDSNGTLLWAKGAGGTNAESANAVAVDVGGNSYLTGYFTSTNAFFDTVVTTNNTGGNDVFVAQLNGDPPALTFSRSGGNLVFSWPTNQLGFVLESNSVLNGGNPWSVITNAPAAIGGLKFVTNSIALSSNVFFRLKK